MDTLTLDKQETKTNMKKNPIPKIYTHEEVIQKSTEYFKGDTLAANVWLNKYALKDSNNNLYESYPDDMHVRLANELVRIEKKYDNPLTFDEIYEVLKDFKYIVPQGGPMSGIGNNHQISSLSNCLRGDTKVLTRDGFKPIESLSNKNVEIMTKGGSWVTAPFKNYGKQNLYKISLIKGKTNKKDIYCTIDHNWFVYKKRNSPKLTSTKELKKGHKLHSEFGKGRNGYILSSFGISHGITFGDGHTVIGENNYNNISLCSESRALKKYFPECYVSSDEKLCEGGSDFYSGLPNYYRELPNIRENKSYLLGWLSGYFAADGNIDERGSAAIHSSKIENISFVQDVCGVLGIGCGEIQSQTVISNLTNRPHTMYKIFLHTNHLNKNFFLLRKHKIRYKKTDKSMNKWVVEKVIKTDLIENVFCAEVPDTFSFVVESNILSGNCFVIGNEGGSDSYGGIMKIDEEQIQLMKRRGGVGHDLSNIRPSGSSVKNSALTSTGIVPFMERYSNSTREVAQDGRRGALMLSISIKHPDVENFIDAKMDSTKVTGANVSVKITDDFMKSVIDKTEYVQQYPIDSDNPKIRKTINPNDLWDKIVNNAWKSAEPGILFWDTIIRESVPDCYENFETVSTNPSLRWNTKVLTKGGIKNIKDLSDNNNGDVIVKNILGEWQKGKAFKSGINKQLYKITFTNSAYEIYCTPEHKWPLVNTNGQIINKSTNRVLKKETKNLSRLDKIYFPQFDDVLNINGDLSYDDGFICGWNLGDGWVSYHKLQKTNSYGFIFSKDDHKNKISNKVLNYINNINERKCNLRENKGCYEFTTSSSSVNDLFNKFGLTNKKDGLPSISWESNDNYVKGLIDGIFSSDGSVDEKNRIITLTTCHEKMANDIHKLLSFYGVKSYLIKGEHQNPFDKSKISYRYDLRITNKSIIKFNNFFKLSHLNKQLKIDNIINSNNYGKYSKNSEILSNREYLVVKSVELTDVYEDVYDITVYDDTHTFQTEVGITGNCGEIPLCKYDSCRLLAINLYSYVNDPFTKKAKFDFKLFRKHAKLSQRIMDDIIDLEVEKIDQILKKVKSDPEEDIVKLRELDLWKNIKQKAIEGRRTGIGITAEGDMLAALNLRYGSDKGIKFSTEIHKVLATEVYSASVDLSKERGAFPSYDFDKEKENPFVNRLFKEMPSLKSKMKKYGRRNIALLTIAPTGTTSLMTQTTSGIEPVFMVSYKRRRKINPNDRSVTVSFVDEIGDSWEEFNVFHHKFEDWLKVNNYNVEEVKNMGDKEVKKIIKLSPYYKATSNDVDWVSKVKMQGDIQKWVDHSISVTVNVPENIEVEKISEIYKTAWESGCKGITVYRDGSRSGVLISNEKKEDIIEFKETKAPSRPARLEASIIRFQNNLEKWIAIIGLYEDRPYEIFTGKLDDSFYVPNWVESGYVVRHKDEKTGKSRYDFEYEDKDGYIQSFRGLNRTFDKEFWNYGKLISGILRHGMPLPFVVELVDNLSFSLGSINTWKNGISRSLKKFIPDGTKDLKNLCIECSQDSLVYKEGCLMCSNCGYSKC